MKRSSLHCLLGALLVLLCAGTGCDSGPSPSASDEPDTVRAQSQVAVSIGAQDVFSEASKGRVSALGFSYQDVARIRVDVSEQGAGGAVYFRDFDLKGSGGTWAGLLPFLPKDQPLTFSARALDASGALLFEGTLDQTLQQDRETLTIPLSPSN
ncbi:MAG: RTX toxin, partial [Myxococcaceae bacterium]